MSFDDWLMTDGKSDGSDGKSIKFYRHSKAFNDKTLSSLDGSDGDFFNSKLKIEK